MSQHQILIYRNIGKGDGRISAEDINREIESLGELTESDELVVRLNSGGGSVTEGIAIYNSFIEVKAKVIMKLDCYAGSITSVIAMAGDEIHMPETCMMMLHPPSNQISGNAKQLREQIEVLEKWSENIISAYSRKSGLPREKVEALLEKDTWLNAVEAKALGLATHITDDELAEATFDLSQFSNVPETVSGVISKPNNKGKEKMADKKKEEPQMIGIDPEKLTNYTEMFGAENAIAWINLDKVDALQKHNEILLKRVDESQASVEDMKKKLEESQEQMQALDKGEPEAIDKGDSDGDGDSNEGPKSLADLVNIK